MGIAAAMLIGPDTMDRAQADDGSKSRTSVGSASPESEPETDVAEESGTGISGVVIEPKLVEKQLSEKSYQQLISMDIEWHVAKAAKPVRTLKGRLLVQDLFDETKLGVGWTIDRPLRQGERFAEKGSGFKFNQFMDSHAWMRATAKDDMKLAFEPTAVVYEDGTAEGLDEDAPRNSIVRPVLLDKRLEKQNYQTYIWMDIRWETDDLPRQTRALKGVLHLTDLFGEPRLSIDITLDEPLKPGEPFTQKGTGFKYNQFMSSHSWVRTTKTDHIRAVFVPSSAIYADGTRQDF